MPVFSVYPGQPVTRPFKLLATADRRSFGAEFSEKGSFVWRMETEVFAKRINIEDRSLASGHILMQPGEDPLTAVTDAVSRFREAEWAVEYMNLPPGRYFPRIARPHHQHPYDPPTVPLTRDFLRERTSAEMHAIRLCHRLDAAFRVVDPDPRNLDAFGSEFRDILILAAMEVEAQAKGILRANSYVGGQNWTMNDYVKLEPALRLADYAVTLTRFPWLEPIKPFEGWATASPSKSLAWYSAYNDVKHDREGSGNRATLGLAMKAVAAAVVMGVAQFAVQYLDRSPDLSQVFGVYAWPRWSIGDTVGVVNDEPFLPIEYPF